MGKKKTPNISIPEMDVMLEGMKELLTDEYGNPLPPDHPQVKKFQSLVERIGDNMDSRHEHEDEDSLSGHA